MATMGRVSDTKKRTVVPGAEQKAAQLQTSKFIFMSAISAVLPESFQ
jgi:hypothetical protein